MQNLFLVFCFLYMVSGASAAWSRNVFPPHPRLRLTPTELNKVRQVTASDPIAAGMLRSITTAGNRLLTAPTLVHNKSGPGQLLGVAGGFVNRMYTLGFLHRLCNGTDARWAARAVVEMRSIANFSDWNPAHFLDTAEMSHGIAIGYDWAFDAIAAEDRRLIEGAVLRNGFGAFLKSIRARDTWARGDWNWNQVVHGGMTTAALAFVDCTLTPGLADAAKMTLEASTSGLTAAFASYAPQGAWPEGAGYW